MNHLEVRLGPKSVALIDESDADLVLPLSWSKHISNGLHYAHHVRRNGEDFRLRYTKMHRLIMGVTGPEYDAFVVDHINGNGLDNRRANMRICKQGENGRNIHNIWGHSEFRGVTKGRTKWRARIRLNRELIDIGSFDTERDAAIAYNFAATRLFGEFYQPAPVVLAQLEPEEETAT